MRIEDLIKRFKTQDPFAFIHINKCGGSSIERVLNLPTFHDTALQRRALIGSQRWNEIYKFAVVRHPYSKVLSHFHYRVKTNQTRLNDLEMSVEDWIELTYGMRDIRFYDKPLMFAPCADWITDRNNRILVDEVFQLETLGDSWIKLCGKLGVGPVALDQEKRTHGFTRETALQQLSESSVAIIQDRFQVDFEMFNYEP